MPASTSSDEERYYIEGRLIYEEGYAAGRRQYAGGDPRNPYGEDHWTAQVWFEGFERGRLELQAQSEPLLTYPE